MGARCQATNQAGKPCSATTRAGRPFCAWHDPALAAERRRWSVQGGQGKSNRKRATRDLAGAVLTLPEVSGLLSIALRKVATGTMEPGPANALANLARALVATQQAGELADRLTALEEAAGITDRGSA